MKLNVLFLRLLLADQEIWWNRVMTSSLSEIGFNGFKMDAEMDECLQMAIRIFKAFGTSWYLLVLVIRGGDTVPIPFPYGYPWVGVKKAADSLRSACNLTAV